MNPFIGPARVLILALGLAITASLAETPATPLSQQVRAALLAGEFQSARELGNRYVQELEQQFGVQAPQLVAPLANLATATLEVREYREAAGYAERALRVLDANPPDQPRTRAQLLLIQGRALVNAEDYSAAGVALRKAESVAGNRSADDPVLLAQVYEAQLEGHMHGSAKRTESIDSFVADGNRIAARQLNALEQAFGEKSADFAESLLTVMPWYRMSGQGSREIQLHNRALRILEATVGPRDERLSVPLRGLAAVRVRTGDDGAEARQAAGRARELDYSDAPASAVAKADAAALLGDVTLVFGEVTEATAYFRESWQILASHPKLGPAVANRVFDSVVMLYNRPRSAFKTLSTGSRLARNEAVVQTEFTVTALGTVADYKLIDATTGSDWDEVVQQASKQLRYRPRVVDGEPVDTPGIRYQITFE